MVSPYYTDHPYRYKLEKVTDSNYYHTSNFYLSQSYIPHSIMNFRHQNDLKKEKRKRKNLKNSIATQCDYEGGTNRPYGSRPSVKK